MPQPFGEVAGDVTHTSPLSSRGLCTTLALAQPKAANASLSISVTSSALIVAHSFQAMMKGRVVIEDGER
jgi:hypothetical protein